MLGTEMCGVKEEDVGYTWQNHVHSVPRTSNGMGDHLSRSEACNTCLHYHAKCGSKQHVRKKNKVWGRKEKRTAYKDRQRRGSKEERTTSGVNDRMAGQQKQEKAMRPDNRTKNRKSRRYVVQTMQILHGQLPMQNVLRNTAEYRRFSRK